jgi:hypothetical protein
MIASVPTRESAPAEILACRITCVEKAVEFDAAAGRRERVWIRSSISLLGVVEQPYDA